MSLLARVSTLSPGAIIQSAPLNNEFNQLINCLNGTITTKNLLVKFSGTDPVIAVDQTSSGSIEEWRQAGSAKVRIENSGQLNSLIPTGTAPIIVTSTTKCTNLNADQVDGFDLAGNKTAFSFGWFYPVPPAAVESAPSVHSLIVPFTGTITIEQIWVTFSGGSHTAATVLTWTLKRRNQAGTLQADIGTITLDNTNGTINVTYVNDIVDYGSLTLGDSIYPILTTRTGASITETNITISIIGNQIFRS